MMGPETSSGYSPPPVFPSSSSSFVEPPSYADAIFRPANPPTAGNSTSDYLEITVTDPQKENDSHITYLITTTIRGDPSPHIVRRRFRHVVALADRLSESFRGLFVPIRPDKGVVEGQVMAQHEFLERRREAVEKYLRRLAAHPVVGRGEEIRVFLRGEGEELELSPATGTGTGTGRGGRDLMRMFRELKQSVANDWGGTKPLAEEEDRGFLERKGVLQEFALQLNAVSEQVLEFIKLIGLAV